MVGLLAAALAVAAGWGLLVGLLLYSCAGSTALVAFSLAWAEPRPALARVHRGREDAALA